MVDGEGGLVGPAVGKIDPHTHSTLARSSGSSGCWLRCRGTGASHKTPPEGKKEKEKRD